VFEHIINAGKAANTYSIFKSLQFKLYKFPMDLLSWIG